MDRTSLGIVIREGSRAAADRFYITAEKQFGFECVEEQMYCNGRRLAASIGIAICIALLSTPAIATDVSSVNLSGPSALSQSFVVFQLISDGLEPVKNIASTISEAISDSQYFL